MLFTVSLAGPPSTSSGTPLSQISRDEFIIFPHFLLRYPILAIADGFLVSTTTLFPRFSRMVNTVAALAKFPH